MPSELCWSISKGMKILQIKGFDCIVCYFSRGFVEVIWTGFAVFRCVTADLSFCTSPLSSCFCFFFYVFFKPFLTSLYVLETRGSLRHACASQQLWEKMTDSKSVSLDISQTQCVSVISGWTLIEHFIWHIVVLIAANNDRMRQRLTQSPEVKTIAEFQREHWCRVSFREVKGQNWQ